MIAVSGSYLYCYFSWVVTVTYGHGRKIKIDRVHNSLWNKSSIYLDYIKFRTRLNQFGCSKNMKTVFPDEKNVVPNENSVEGNKTMYK